MTLQSKALAYDCWINCVVQFGDCDPPTISTVVPEARENKADEFSDDEEILNTDNGDMIEEYQQVPPHPSDSAGVPVRRVWKTLSLLIDREVQGQCTFEMGRYSNIYQQ